MKTFKYFSICCKYLGFVSLFSCSGFSTKPYSFTKPSGENFMSSYCVAGKQTKAFKINVAYFAPTLEIGIAINAAATMNQKLDQKRIDELKNIFYILSTESGSEQIHNHGDEPSWYLLSAENSKDVLDNIKEEDSTSKYRLYTFMIKIENENKVIIYKSNLSSRRMNYSKGYSTDLNELFSKYTLLLPKEIIEKSFNITFDSKYPYKAIILDNSGEIDISKAINRRDDLWKKYVEAFTVIKEAQSDNLQQTNVELSLDLNLFCKYGRAISDLQSQ